MLEQCGKCFRTNLRTRFRAEPGSLRPRGTSGEVHYEGPLKRQNPQCNWPSAGKRCRSVCLVQRQILDKPIGVDKLRLIESVTLGHTPAIRLSPLAAVWSRLVTSSDVKTTESRMDARRVFSLGLLVAVFSPLAGCATILSDRSWPVTVDNSGGPTYFVIKDRKNQVVQSGVTPQQVVLKSSAGPFRPARYHVEYAGENGVNHQTINSKINWWTAGNIVIGGVPGIVVDAGTGAMWRLEDTVVGEFLILQLSLIANRATPLSPTALRQVLRRNSRARLGVRRTVINRIDRRASAR